MRAEAAAPSRQSHARAFAWDEREARPVVPRGCKSLAQTVP